VFANNTFSTRDACVWRDNTALIRHSAIINDEQAYRALQNVYIHNTNNW